MGLVKYIKNDAETPLAEDIEAGAGVTAVILIAGWKAAKVSLDSEEGPILKLVASAFSSSSFVLPSPLAAGESLSLTVEGIGAEVFVYRAAETSMQLSLSKGA